MAGLGAPVVRPVKVGHGDAAIGTGPAEIFHEAAAPKQAGSAVTPGERLLRLSVQ
jgi:hypothetical protein